MYANPPGNPFLPFRLSYCVFGFTIHFSNLCLNSLTCPESATFGSTLAISAGGAPGSELSVASIFSDGMVLQRGELVPVWGWADAGATVAVQSDIESMLSIRRDSSTAG